VKHSTYAAGMDEARTALSIAVSLTVWGVPARRVPAAIARMGLDRRLLRGTPGLRFAKLLGTGNGRTFTLRDADPRHWALLTVWDDAADAHRFTAGTTHRRWNRLAEERLDVLMTPLASRGLWAGREPFAPFGPFGLPTEGGLPAGTGATGKGPTRGGRMAGGGRIAGDARVTSGEGPTGGGRMAGGSRSIGPVASITRARLRPSRALSFWRAVPPVSTDLATVDGLGLAIGIGESPIGLQGTFSLWRSADDLNQFAYRRAAHADVIHRTDQERWYAEELFARFAVSSVSGTFGGRRPLAE
jgi:heme-degrading monooxygenase HmoA